MFKIEDDKRKMKKNLVLDDITYDKQNKKPINRWVEEKRKEWDEHAM